MNQSMGMDEFIATWWGKKGGAERSNFSAFIPDLCEALGLPRPMSAEAGKLGEYEYEGTVKGGSFRSLKASGSIDLYKRGCFVMEAKQSQLTEAQRATPDLFDPEESAPQAPSGARYDRLMIDARRQAENYAKNLPADHPAAPFLIVCDVGRAFELYFDWSGNGRGYGFFPDKQSYRIALPQLASQNILGDTGKTPAEILKAIWLDPQSIDPRLKSAEVTREVAKRLADVSKWLEEVQRLKTAGLSSQERSLAVEESALFLMRLLFCMFAEDIELLPKDRFKAFLERSITNEKLFEQGLADLWLKMGNANVDPRFAHALEEDVRYFNGGLFESNRTYSLDKSSIGALFQAARADWKNVEPAIFGTLLEQALTAEERAKLGAHYTPRPYVERLVQATIMDVLEVEWEAARGGHDDPGTTLAAATAFHARLKALRILDPACGTGNFLYVAMELLQRLESDVIELIEQLGSKAEPDIGPHQFFGLELNPRAAKIAELVLWIGWLRNRLHDDPDAVPQPVLAESASINFGRHGGYDAVLTRTAIGEPDYANPMQPAWPEADFIVGNPPFIGGKDLRDKLGSDYAQGLWKANPRVPKSADFVMQWWDRAAHLLTAKGSPLIRFGFVTTNSITQTFSRRVIENYLAGQGNDEGKLSLQYAVADHPWTKATKDAAAVRIAMTVAERGEHEGQLIEVVQEKGLDTDKPDIATTEFSGRINADLTVGSDVTAVVALKANEGLASPGVKLHGSGFIVTPSEAEALGLGRREGLESYIRPYRNGRDLLQHSRGAMVIDLFGLDEKQVRQRFPEVYEHILRTVKPERDANRRESYKRNWWTHGEPRREMRPALAGLSRYIATVETAKHRVFQFLDAEILPDNMLIAIGSDDAFHLGVSSSRFHSDWALGIGGTLEDRPRYNKSQIFDPFPFPDATPDQRASIAELAEELDEARKAALAETPGLTMTELYNLREKLRSSAPLSAADQDRARAARAGIVNRLHEQIDEAVAAAYGWPANLTPSEIVARLVMLNAERAAEAAQGQIRWLRPDYQIPRFGVKKG